ncbi:hypothetical protein BU25DRAFT_128690 [Macroventuria anomochaeta]|uniref:Uncharacterized protein n=1 Tax=Macroventuria anomochaeta TaxID=301207 RepID=A0ACB6RSG0_9PLEO|nr:uncharacterized protein BU25DRAFT_128690 [Macroventuria anomochaeta]KAF2624920.1 hypothetical protein BU25DRAFT_128690 [Macroventuria anomochaeta]
MVATRRSGANAAPTSNAPSKPTKRRKFSDSATVDKLEKTVTAPPSISREPSLSTNITALLKSSSELSDLTLTSPSTGRTPGKGSPSKIVRSLHEQARPSAPQVMAALQKLVTPGSSHNPIVLVEDSPRSKAQARTKQHDKVEPHRFQDRHSKLYTYKPPRPALAPKPANGSTFTGHPNHDMYRMRTAKMAQPVWHLSRNQNVRQGLPGLPFEMQYPMSAQYLASQQGAALPPTRPGIQYYAPPPPSYLRHKAPLLPTEEQLRRKAVKHVREYSRSSPRKRKMAVDPEETSESESDEVNHNFTISMRKTYPTQTPGGSAKLKSSPITILPDPHFQLTPLIEHASLLTSLLRAYPHSADQKGLREDIAMLVSVQNQHLADWLNSEVGQSRKAVPNLHTPCVSRSTTTSLIKPLTHHLTDSELTEAEKKRKQDEEVRGLLSADAKLWQDGSGLGVADVYRGSRASTPAASQDEENEPQEESAIVATSPPVRCTAEAPAALPDIVATSSSPLARTSIGSPVKSLPKVVASAASPVARPGTQRLVTPSPKVARTVLCRLL